jgi:putative two-component system response regulator
VAGQARTDNGGAAKRVLILVVEVDPYIRALQRSLLEEEYQLEFAGDGEAALALARTLTPRLLLADILVPKIDGLRVCRELKRDPRTRDIRVAIFSELYAERRAYEAGADAFIQKPVDEELFLARVRALLDAAPATSASPPGGAKWTE